MGFLILVFMYKRAYCISVSTQNSLLCQSWCIKELNIPLLVFFNRKVISHKLCLKTYGEIPTIRDWMKASPSRNYKEIMTWVNLISPGRQERANKSERAYDHGTMLMEMVRRLVFTNWDPSADAQLENEETVYMFLRIIAYAQQK